MGIYALQSGAIRHVEDIHNMILPTSFQEDILTSSRFDIIRTSNGILLPMVVDYSTRFEGQNQIHTICEPMKSNLTYSYK